MFTFFGDSPPTEPKMVLTFLLSFFFVKKMTRDSSDYHPPSVGNEGKEKAKTLHREQYECKGKKVRTHIFKIELKEKKEARRGLQY